MDLFCSHPWPKWPAPMMFYTKSDLFAPGISGRGDLAPTVCWAGNRGYSIRIWYSCLLPCMGANASVCRAVGDARADSGRCGVLYQILIE